MRIKCEGSRNDVFRAADQLIPNDCPGSLYATSELLESRESKLRLNALSHTCFLGKWSLVTRKVKTRMFLESRIRRSFDPGHSPTIK
jgi:hypothetical protein